MIRAWGLTATVLLLLTLQVGHVDAALLVNSGPVRAMDPTEEHRVLEQLWSVDAVPSSNPFRSDETLQLLKISIPGRVYVSYNFDLSSSREDPDVPATAARVRFSGNSEDIFKTFEVAGTGAGLLEIRRRPGVRAVLKDAYMLVEISLSRSNLIKSVINTGSAEVVVEDGVLVSSKSQPALDLQTHGSGDLFVESGAPVHVTSASLSVSGSGSIHWSAAAIQTSTLSVQIAGSGDATLLAQSVDAAASQLHIAGSGDVCIHAPRFQGTSIFTETVGSGSMSISSDNGVCTREDISVLGSGDVLLGAVRSKDVKLTIAGSGDVFVQADHSIYGSRWGSGDVKYVGGRPQLISDKHDDSAFSTQQKRKYKPIAKAKSSNRFISCRAAAVPPRAAVKCASSFFGLDGAAKSSILAPLVFFALLSACYLRRQTKRSRRSYRYSPDELQPLRGMPMMHPLPQQQQPLQQQQQQQQQQQSQVYV